MTEPRHDDPSDPALSRLYRAHAGAEPSTAANRHILAAARLAAAPQATRRGGWWQRWRMPLTLAATVMLTATLALLVERQSEELSTLKALSTAPGREKPRTESAQEHARQPASAAPAARQRQAPAAPPIQESVPKPHPGNGEHDRPQTSEIAADRALASPASAAKAENVSRPAGAASEAGNIATRGELRGAAPATAALAKSRAAPPRAPAVWLEEIRALRSAGKREEAERQLRAFRLAHPDYPLPEEFRQ